MENSKWTTRWGKKKGILIRVVSQGARNWAKTIKSPPDTLWILDYLKRLKESENLKLLKNRVASMGNFLAQALIYDV